LIGKRFFNESLDEPNHPPNQRSPHDLTKESRYHPPTILFMDQPAEPTHLQTTPKVTLPTENVKAMRACREENKSLISPMVAKKGYVVSLQNNSLLAFGNNNIN
jgi:hypothetical protein